MQQLRKRAIASGCSVVLMGVFACSRPEPGSPIVEKVEQAGSGDLAAVSKDGMREWLGKHKDVAYQVDGMCSQCGRTRPHNGPSQPRVGCALRLANLRFGVAAPLPAMKKRTHRA
jgi:hypothetical protein